MKEKEKLNLDEYAKTEELQKLLFEKYGDKGVSVKACIPTAAEYQLIRMMVGIKDGEPLVVARGEVWVEGQKEPFVDYGTTTPKNLTGYIKFDKYALEMASRRATNRAMRLATGTELDTVDEDDVKEDPNLKGGEKQGQQPPPLEEGEVSRGEYMEACNKAKGKLGNDLYFKTLKRLGFVDATAVADDPKMHKYVLDSLRDAYLDSTG